MPALGSREQVRSAAPQLRAPARLSPLLYPAGKGGFRKGIQPERGFSLREGSDGGEKATEGFFLWMPISIKFTQHHSPALQELRAALEQVPREC